MISTIFLSRGKSSNENNRTSSGMLSGKFEKYANLWYNKYAFYI
jgi:hypothetical protein